MIKMLLTVFLLISFMANAQFIKGDKVLSGVLSFYSQDAPNSQNGGLANNVKRFGITPSIGFLLNDNFAIGGQLGYSSNYQEISNYSSSILKFESQSFSVGIYGQRYFKISDKFLFSLLGQFSFARGFNIDTNFDQMTGEGIESKTQNYDLTTSIRPNFIFFPSPKWAFDASIGSISHTFSRVLSTDEKANVFSLNYGTITFGISFYLSRSTDN